MNAPMTPVTRSTVLVGDTAATLVRPTAACSLRRGAASVLRLIPLLSALAAAGCNTGSGAADDLLSDVEDAQPADDAREPSSDAQDIANLDASGDLEPDGPEELVDASEIDSDAPGDATDSDIAPVREVCDNGLDDDQDGLVDCDDPECEVRPVCDHYPATIVYIEGHFSSGAQFRARRTDAWDNLITLTERTVPGAEILRSLCVHPTKPLVAYESVTAEVARLVMWDLGDNTQRTVTYPDEGFGLTTCVWLNDESLLARLTDPNDFRAELRVVDPVSLTFGEPLVRADSVSEDGPEMIGAVSASHVEGSVVYTRVTNLGDPFTGEAGEGELRLLNTLTGAAEVLLEQVPYSIRYAPSLSRYIVHLPSGERLYDEAFESWDALGFDAVGALWSLGRTRFVEGSRNGLHIRSSSGETLQSSDEDCASFVVLPGRADEQ
ncbi:MAG: hypothetical protein ACI82G_001831, partial [Bradymonadia bacterium]